MINIGEHTNKFLYVKAKHKLDFVMSCIFMPNEVTFISEVDKQ